MRIAIDASRTTELRITGTEHYALRLIQTLIRLNTAHHLTLYFRDTPPQNLFPASDLVETRVIPFRRLWTHARFAAELWRDRPDVTFVPAHTLPALFPGRAVVTVHDLGFRYFPQAHPTKQRLYLNATTGYSARRAAVVLADSHATADDLTKFYGIPAAKIRVVYPGVDAPQPATPPSLAASEAVEDPTLPVRAKYELPERYFLFLGTLQPRKNIARLMQAYRRWRETHPDDNTGLVLVGGKGWLYDSSWAEGVEGIYVLGYAHESDKGALYAGALALVFPSLYEGFGFPVIEAMHCGTPVICSRTSSLPELAGDAALLVDPLDVESVAGAMSQISDDPALRQSLRVKGYQQALKFTWTAAAKEAMAALEAAGV
jgi:glycosyltransferase involved in cell wall biosynthesis